MKLLEQRAQVMAAEAEADKPKTKKDILFVRGNAKASDAELAEAARTTNPEEINIDDDDDDDSGEDVDEVQVETQAIPTEVYGNIQQQE